MPPQIKDANGDLYDDKDEGFSLFLAVAYFDRLFTWMDKPIDAPGASSARVWQQVAAAPPRDQPQSRNIHDWLGIPLAFRLDCRSVASGESMLIVYDWNQALRHASLEMMRAHVPLR